MSSSLYNLDRTAHLKIVILAAIAAILVVCVGRYSVLGGSVPAVSASEPHLVAPKADREHPPAPAAHPKNLRTEIA